MAPKTEQSRKRFPVDGDAIRTALSKDGVLVLPPMDVKDCLAEASDWKIDIKTTILDPWYNKGFGGIRPDYDDFIVDLLALAASISQHVFLWGFPEIIARFVDRTPAPLTLVAWLTWYYKNSPSVIRGWRSSQNACLHLSRPGAKLYPEHFLNAAQKKLQAQGKLRYMPGPTSVIEEPLLVGFVGRNEQTGHPSQKPMAVFERLILMTTNEGDIVLDPMSGSGTTGDCARKLGRRAILCDSSQEYTEMAMRRLGLDGAAGTIAVPSGSSDKPRGGRHAPFPGGLFDDTDG